MKQIKLDYEAPVAQTFVVRFEGNLLTGSPQWGNKNDAATVGDEEDDRIYSF